MINKRKLLPVRPTYKEEKYVEYDNEYEVWGIFGVDSGFCYATYSSEEEANRDILISYKY
jgi:hypothetical protein